MSKALTLPARAKRTQRIGEAPDASIPMLAELAQRIERLQILERLASSPLYVAVANAAHAINSYSQTASINAEYDAPALTWYCYQSDLKRWDDPRYLDALASFGKLPGEAAYSVKENKDNLHRVHKWEWSFQTGNESNPVAIIRVQLDAYESAETAECRKVQVGTRTIEEPIYRYDCVAPEGNAGELPAPVIALDL
jgi:hypothetical protein